MLLVRFLLDAAAGTRFRRKVYPDVDKHHYAAGYVERAERRVQNVADVTAELLRVENGNDGRQLAWILGMCMHNVRGIIC